LQKSVQNGKMTTMEKLRKLFLWLLRAVLMSIAASCATAPHDTPQSPAENERMEVPMGNRDDTVPATSAKTGISSREDAENEVAAGILLGFDDTYYANWEAAFALFEQYGARVTFFVQGNRPFCLNALAHGHDIGYHTENHIDLRNADNATWLRETLDSARSLQDIPLASFAYPFGFSESWMDAELLKTYAIIRGFGTTPRFYTREEIKTGIITSKSIDNTIIPDDETFCQTITDLLQTTKTAGNVILPLTTHNIDDTAQWGIKTYRLEFLLKTATDMGLRFYTYRELTEK
jgi:peptidoglycan/xylan/chitin deacetylase (PgdA/CDA1 family)